MINSFGALGARRVWSAYLTVLTGYVSASFRYGSIAVIAGSSHPVRVSREKPRSPPRPPSTCYQTTRTCVLGSGVNDTAAR